MNIDAPKQTRKKGKPHGGKGGAEPQSTVQRREHEVLERRAQCQSQHEIAKALGISQPAVSKILRRLGARWARENKALLDQHRFEAAMTLRRLLREAFEEWQRSRAAHVRKRQRKQEGGKVLSEVWIDETPGDPRFLDQLGQLLDRLALAQGLSAASQRPIVGKEYSEEFQREVATAKQRLHEQHRKAGAICAQAPCAPEARDDVRTTGSHGRKGAGLIEAIATSLKNVVRGCGEADDAADPDEDE